SARVQSRSRNRNSSGRSISGPGSLARIRTCGSSLADAMSSMVAEVVIKSVRLTGSEPGRRVETVTPWLAGSRVRQHRTGVDVSSTSRVTYIGAGERSRAGPHDEQELVLAIESSHEQGSKVSIPVHEYTGTPSSSTRCCQARSTLASSC